MPIRGRPYATGALGRGALALVDAEARPVSGASLSIAVDGLTIDHVGQRLRLPHDPEQQLHAAIRQRQPLDVAFTFEADWPAAAAPVLAHARVQVIIVVDTLRAL